MYKIKEFSILAKTTVKTLRYYDKEDLLKPYFIDSKTGYRFYETEELVLLSKIISLRQLGISIPDIKDILNKKNVNQILNRRKKEIEDSLQTNIDQLSRINYMLEGYNMKYEVTKKELPEVTIYYKEGIIKDFSELTNFILSSEKECRSTNPNIKCITPDYCYVNYLDHEYKETNIKVRYAQAVVEAGIPNETIKFEKLKPVEALSIYHKGPYQDLREAYSFIIKYIKDNGYQISEPIRERYIDGMWNKENPKDWLTEIQVPVIKA